jgi:hypothetical protein
MEESGQGTREEALHPPPEARPLPYTGVMEESGQGTREGYPYHTRA